MKRLIAISLLFVLLDAGDPQSIVVKHKATGCTPFTVVNNQWFPSTSCSSGSVCLNDAVGGDNLVSATQYPTYEATGGPGGVPDVKFIKANSNKLVLGSNIGPDSSTYTTSMYVIVQPDSATDFATIIGGDSGGRLAYNVTYYSAHQNLEYAYTYIIGTGTTTWTIGSTWYAIATTVTGSGASGTAWNFYKISSGTYASDGSGTNATAAQNMRLNESGYNVGAGQYGSFKIAEIGYYNGIFTSGNLSTLATYVNCKYPTI